MRVQQLLAIAMVCPLAALCVACAPIDQSVGTYRASHAAPSDAPPATTAHVPDETAAAGSGSVRDAHFPSNTPPIGPIGGAYAPDLPPTTTTPETQPVPPMSGSGAAPEGVAGGCKPTPLAAERKPVDMYMVVDLNVALPYTGLWEFLSNGLRAFVRDPANRGNGLGLRYFGAQCDADTYDRWPTVEIGQLPNNESALLQALNQRVDFGASHLAPALRGGIAHQMRRAKENPGIKQVVVLVSYGFTQELTCPYYSPAELANIAAEGFNGDIETYVVGFGMPNTMNAIADDVLSRFSPLDGIARLGGTRTATTLKMGDDSALLRDALASIRRRAQPCQFTIPESVDPGSLNLSLFGYDKVPRVDSPARCGQASGFFYNAEKPTEIELCPSSCRELQAADVQATLLSGCPTVRR